MKQVIADLNPEQRQAVEAGDGPVMIVAGPGTGKTKTLVARIAWLIKTGRCKPGEILALTFSKKAAKELRTRLADLLPGNSLPRISTFHALCYDVLAEKHGIAPKLAHDTERLAIIKALRKQSELKGLSARELASRISLAKNLTAQGSRDNPLTTLIHAYNSELQRQGLRDFDDLLQEAYEGLTVDENRPTCRYVLVDEFQDTSQLQYDLLRCFTQSDNLFVIGDPRQSIYGFRGAQSGIFEQFQADFPDAQIITLQVNYRSAPEIVELINAIFPAAKKLVATVATAGLVRNVQVLNEYSEADWVVSQIEHALGGTDFLRARSDQTKPIGQNFADFAVLYRTHNVAKTLQQGLERSGIPYQVVGEDSPYAQPLAQALIQTFRYLMNSSEVKLEVVAGLPVYKKLSPEQLNALLEPLQSIVPTLQPSEMADRLVASWELPVDKAFAQFMSTLIRFDKRGVAAFLAYLDEIAEQEFYDPRADAVTLTSIHAAKGLEFRHIFLLAAEEGVLPHERGEYDEERRLFYVALTRAQNRLDVLYTKNRAGKLAAPSRFVTELDAAVLPRLIDPDLATQQRRITKRRYRRSQLGLFG